MQSDSPPDASKPEDLFSEDLALPYTTKTLKVINLGIPKYHQKNYIIPVGFESIKTYNGSNYKNEILDSETGPVFRVTDLSTFQTWSAKSVSNVWSQVGTSRLVDTPKKANLSGPAYFGLSDPRVKRAIELKNMLLHPKQRVQPNDKLRLSNDFLKGIPKLFHPDLDSPPELVLDPSSKDFTLPYCTKTLRVISLGMPKYSDKNYIIPVGFESIKNYHGTQYRNEILDNGNGPLFRVTQLDTQQKWEAKSVSNVWTQVAQSRKDPSDLKKANVSGPGYFGLSDPKVKHAIEQLNANLHPLARVSCPPERPLSKKRQSKSLDSNHEDSKKFKEESLLTPYLISSESLHNDVSEDHYHSSDALPYPLTTLPNNPVIHLPPPPFSSYSAITPTHLSHLIAPHLLSSISPSSTPSVTSLATSSAAPNSIQNLSSNVDHAVSLEPHKFNHMEIEPVDKISFF